MMSFNDKQTLMTLMGHKGFFVESQGIIFGVKPPNRFSRSAGHGVAFALVNYTTQEIRQTFKDRTILQLHHVDEKLIEKMKGLLPKLLEMQTDLKKKRLKTLVTFSEVILNHGQK